MLGICAAHPDRVRMYATVNPNYTDHAIAEDRWKSGCVARGAIGVKLLASRRADDPLLDPVASLAGAGRGPRRTASRVAAPASRMAVTRRFRTGQTSRVSQVDHPRTSFILAHIGGGGDYLHTFPAIVDQPNIYPDLSGSGIDRGMLDTAVEALGAERLLWGTDLTMETGLAKLRALDVIGLRGEEIEAIRWRNAVRLFRAGSFPLASRHRVDRGRMIDINTLIGPYPYRHVPHPDPEALLRVLEREELSGAWVGHLPSAFHRDPSAGNAELYAALAPAPAQRRAPASADHSI